MRSIRLDPELDRKVRKAAAVRGESVSAFIRNAASKQAEETLAERGRERFRDVAGAVHGGGGRASRTGEAFTEIVYRPGTRR
jgi:predicted transcriptional regulator